MDKLVTVARSTAIDVFIEALACERCRLLLAFRNCVQGALVDVFVRTLVVRFLS